MTHVHIEASTETLDRPMRVVGIIAFVAYSWAIELSFSAWD